HAIVALAGGGAGRGPRGSRRAPSKSPSVRADGASGTHLVSGRATAASVSGRCSKPRQLEWHLGDKVRVRAERIDPMRKRVEFALISDPDFRPGEISGEPLSTTILRGRR